MSFTPEQQAFLERIANSTDTKMWKSILEVYANEVKDEVMDEKLDPKAGKAAVAKLMALSNKITVLDVEPTARSQNPAI